MLIAARPESADDTPWRGVAPEFLLALWRVVSHQTAIAPTSP
jgi:hypothetical protein